MKFVLFYHSVLSCWNHGNAHFLRGICRELIRLGHDVTVYEPEDGWSRLRALADGGAAVLAETQGLVPGLAVKAYLSGSLDVDRATDGADVVIVHEWNPPALIAELGRRRIAGAPFTLLFHDTHHRAVTAEHEMGRFDLEGYDAVLAFGNVLRDIYSRRGWGKRVFTWHEAADTALFHPAAAEGKNCDLIWIGNWGDNERTRELNEFLFKPVRRLAIRARVHGVRYPPDALARLSAANIRYGGWLPNHRVPAALAHASLTVHIPRRPYTQALPGIPTIRVFEALACGIPLVCAPWSDNEGLFPTGSYLTARNADEMTAAITLLLLDRDLASDLAKTGLQAIREHHNCGRRVHQLLAIIDSLARPPQRTAPAALQREALAS